MRNARSIYYLIGASIIIVINTVFFLFQSSRNQKNYTATFRTGEIVGSAHMLFDQIKDTDRAREQFIVSGDSLYLGTYLAAKERAGDTYRSLFTSLSSDSVQRKNLRHLNQLLNDWFPEKLVALPKPGIYLNEQSANRQALKEISGIIYGLIRIEKEKRDRISSSIGNSVRKSQVFAVVSNWVLLVIVILSLLSIVQNRGKLSGLFEEIERKNDLLESQKNELQGLSQDLIKQNHELERFAYMASHDLRSPGVNLIALIHLYEEAVDEQEKASLMEIIKEVADNQIVKLDELLEMLRSKYESNAVHEVLVFKQVYKNVIKNLSADVKKSGAELHYEFETASIHYPKSYLESIIQNLLSNAIKYRHPNRKPQITIKTYSLQGTIWMEVKDNGMGIDLNKHKESVFGLYQTFHEGDKSKGVGLYITKAQVVAMGGTIEVESSPGAGTLFRINFNQS